jgi:prepilin-type processing-associated H-X9-DG protein
MTPQEMIDYTFGGLDELRQGELEVEIAADPLLAAKLDHLNRGIESLLDDGDKWAPPSGLASRTMARIASQRPRRSFLDLVPVRVPFRWADVAVAAGIFVAGLVTLLPAVHRSQMQTDQTVCSFNLAQLGQGLATYASIHGNYPYPPPNSPIPYAGIFKVMLNDGGHLRDAKTLDCPSNGTQHPQTPLPNYTALCDLRERDPALFRHLINGDYAYHLGFRQPELTGRPGPIVPAMLKARVALLADSPPHDDSGHIFQGNSPNHGGQGQNVLFTDGHVGWFPTRSLGPHDIDMFLNQFERAEPGIGPNDAVLAPGNVRFYDAE